MVGQTISHYHILSELGHGGMGLVYEGEDARLGRRAAIKLLPASASRDTKARRRFENEARAASALDHPNICTIYEIGEDETGHLFIAMALYSGRTLEQVIEDGPVDPDEACRIIREIAAGLRAAHGAGIIHRDIKPGNVMLTDDGRVVILDFGLAKIEEVNITREGESVGTVTYMSPEQARGEPLDHRTDIWSLGVLSYELLSGVRPFKADYAQAVLYTILNEEPTPLAEHVPDVPDGIAAIVADCLEKDPANRPASADEILARLESEISGVAAQPKATPWSRILGISAAMTVLVAALLITVVPELRSSVLGAVGKSDLPSEMHIAVLADPAEAATDDQNALEAGLVETLISTLESVQSGRENFWVVPGDRVHDFGVKSIEQARRSLGVNLVVNTRLSMDDDRVGLSLDLVDTESGRILRSRTLEHPRSEMNVLRAGLPTAVSELLGIRIDTETNQFLNASQTTRPGAAEFYTQGLGYLNRYREGDNLDASIILFRRSIASDSSFALAYAGLCEAYWRKWEDIEDPRFAASAEESCERALEVQADLNAVYITLGRLHTGTGRYGTAIGEFQLVIARDSTNAAAYAGLASAYEGIDRLDDAERMYRRAIALKPDYWGGYRDLGVFYFNLARYEDAIEQFQHVADLNPFNATAYSNIGAIYFYLDRRQEAIEMFRLALDVEENFSAWSNLATLHYYEGQYGQSAQAFERALALSDDSSYDTWGYLATSYEWSGEPEKADDAHRRAVELAREVLEINPRDQEVLAHLASYYAYLGHRDSSLAVLDRLIPESPSDPQELSRIGEAFEILGDRRAAIEWTERALERGYALAEIIDYPGFADLIRDPAFQPVLAKYTASDSSGVISDTDN